MKNLSVQMMGSGRGQGYGYGRGYGSYEPNTGGRGRGMYGRRGENVLILVKGVTKTLDVINLNGSMVICFLFLHIFLLVLNVINPKRMGGDRFPLPSHNPSPAQDYGVEIRGEKQDQVA